MKKIPILDTEYELSAEQLGNYRLNGHILLPNLANANEISEFRQEVLEIMTNFAEEKAKLEDRDTYGKAFLQLTNLWQQKESLKKFILARRFAGIAARLMGSDSVRIYHDQALFKEPGGGPTPWHQDQYYWPLETEKTITMWMPLVDLNDTMGIMNFASCSQKATEAERIAISDSSDHYFKEYIKREGFEIKSASSLKAGDATFHSGWTIHNAPGNNSSAIREVMTVIYYDASSKVAAINNEHRQLDLDTFLPGLKPGEPAVTDLNPLVY